ncbi:hypothetical protein HRbin11_00013 [bacterium HR11]|nr:hypothetical protein HRbin11_00013 [bacterium HR11]
MPWAFLIGAAFPFLDPAGWHLRVGGLEWKPIEVGLGLWLMYGLSVGIRNPGAVRRLRDPVTLLWGLSLLILLVVNSVGAVDPGAALRMGLRWVAAWALFASLRVVRPGPEAARRFLDGFIAGSLMTLLLGLAEGIGEDRVDPWLAWFRTAPTEVEGFRRWASIFEHANVAGVWWALAGLACGFRLHGTSLRTHRWIFGGLAVAFTAGVLLTYSRGAALILGTGWALLTLWERRWGRPKYGLALAVTGIGVGTVLFCTDSVFRERWWPSGRPWVAARLMPTEFPTSPYPTRQKVVVYNAGALRWSWGGRHPVQLAYHLVDEHGRLYCLDVRRYPLPHDVEPGVHQVLEVTVPAVACAPRCRGRWDLVWERVTWFDPTVQQIMFGIRATGGRLPGRGAASDRPPECRSGIYLPPPPHVTAVHQAGRVLQRQRVELGRWRLYALAWDLWRQRPWVGWGLDAFRLRLAEMAGGVWPTGTVTSNQMFLEVLVGGGIVGLGLLALWAIPLIIRLGRRLWASDEGVVYRWMALLIGSTGLWDFMMGFYVVLGLGAISAAWGMEVGQVGSRRQADEG